MDIFDIADREMLMEMEHAEIQGYEDDFKREAKAIHKFNLLQYNDTQILNWLKFLNNTDIMHYALKKFTKEFDR